MLLLPVRRSATAGAAATATATVVVSSYSSCFVYKEPRLAEEEPREREVRGRISTPYSTSLPTPWIYRSRIDFNFFFVHHTVTLPLVLHRETRGHPSRNMLNPKVLLALAVSLAAVLGAPQRLGGGGGGADKDAVITSQQLEVNFDGTYVNNFETSNGISHQESGAPKASGPEGPSVSSQGATSYTAPNGEVVSIQFQADENGYVAQGSHIPTAPPIPPEILRALEWNAAHPEEDNIDSGPPARPPARG